MATSLHFGFSLVYGTSIAAAIAVGIMANAISSRYVEFVEDRWRIELQKAVSNGTDPRNLLPVDVACDRPKLDDLLKAAYQASDASFISGVAALPTHELGWGLIRPFRA